ncbi:hypothetical protein Fleli_2693 [Bernardetia litoralis DSM 6794]|uniref:Uncharacterized protein n=1 Tax=Bernardetia litoralis (strain ATCC 23117 / DSM 6794 / NBRC 15988 / NCIMB 1366 / Fx l1 / Sio-4) TaxID=880071 RepID=I4AM64_BERLS|nr:hypothetical protein [Bernardetia litoralis]AFM05049.1 hypothetical protein Fleli_2693 [Bernardetia litoralis DSM 6794]
MKIGYLLMGKDHSTSKIKSNYKGVFRYGAFRFNPISNENKEELELFMKHVNLLPNDKSEENDFLYDMDIAKDLIKEYKKIGKDFYLMACIDVSEKDESILDSQYKFLGYDICDRAFQSLLRIEGYKPTNKFSQDLPDDIEDKYLLNFAHTKLFSDLLNENELLNSHLEAKALIQERELLIKKHPEFDTIHTDIFYIYKLYEISN